MKEEKRRKNGTDRIFETHLFLLPPSKNLIEAVRVSEMKGIKA